MSIQALAGAGNAAGIEQAREGDEAILFGAKDGETMPGEALCEILDTIPYELTSMVGSRVPRAYVED